MKALVVGGDGLIGSALVSELLTRGVDVVATTRRADRLRNGRCFLDLAHAIDDLPVTEFVFLVAAMPKVFDCQGSELAWRVNADAPIAIAQAVAGHGTHVVFVSSDSIHRFGSCDYARAKLHVEGVLQAMRATIVRPAPVARDRAHECAAFIADVGLARLTGVQRWT